MESKKAFGAVSFDVSCLERTLFVLIPEKYIGKEKEILALLREAYDEWCEPPDEVVECSCCEEHMLCRLSEKFPDYVDSAVESWNTDCYLC